MARWTMGDSEEAERAEIEAIRLLSGLREGTGVALCLDALAWTSASWSDFERSARLQGPPRPRGSRYLGNGRNRFGSSPRAAKK